MDDQGRKRSDHQRAKGARKQAKMANDEKDQSAMPPPASTQTSPATGGRTRPPAWARDLRALYDSVVEEPLPDTFMDLLSKLDQDPE